MENWGLLFGRRFAVYRDDVHGHSLHARDVNALKRPS